MWFESNKGTGNQRSGSFAVPGAASSIPDLHIPNLCGLVVTSFPTPTQLSPVLSHSLLSVLRCHGARQASLEIYHLLIM